MPGRDDVGALRLRTVATKNRPCADFPSRSGDGYDATSCSSSIIGRLRRGGPDMRLPADATLIVLGAPLRAPAEVPGPWPEAKVGGATCRVACGGAPDRPRSRRAGWPPGPLQAGSALLAVETSVEHSAGAAFAGSALGEALDAIGATTLVLSGDAAAMPVAAWSAAAFGCHVFVVADACWGGEDGVASISAALAGADVKIVNCVSALAAASLAKVRQRRAAARRG